MDFEERESQFWELLGEGASFTAACQAVGVDRRRGYRWRRARSLESITGRPRPPSGRYLSLEERLQIADLHRHGDSVRKIAATVGRSPSTISRELSRNGVATGDGQRRYAPYRAQRSAERRARRPKLFKLSDPVFATVVAQKLRLRWSPEQISQHLKSDPVLIGGRVGTVSHETIYKALFVQGRGRLRAELHQCFRSGGAWRRSNHAGGGARKVRIPNMINISERPAEVADRAVPGHWEGDLIMGSNCRSAIATLVERQTRYCLLVGLPDGHRAKLVAAALIKTIQTLPAHLRRSLTWDQGMEMMHHSKIKLATDLHIYFCDPHSALAAGQQ